jgi:hypothetical protein
MKDLKQFLIEAQREKRAVFTFGRMNPPTAGHAKVVDVVMRQARKERAEPFIFVSQTQDRRKNPLSFSQKIRFLKLGLDNQAAQAVQTIKTIRTPFEAAGRLSDLGYTHVTMVVGSDRVEEFEQQFKKYVGSEFKFTDFKVVSAGERDPDSEGVSGISASQMRNYAEEGNKQKFLRGVLPKLSPRYSKELFDLIRVNMGLTPLSEEFEYMYCLNESLNHKPLTWKWIERASQKHKAIFKFEGNNIEVSFEKSPIKESWLVKFDLLQLWNSLTRQNRKQNLTPVTSTMIYILLEFLELVRPVRLEFDYIHSRDDSDHSVRHFLRKSLYDNMGKTKYKVTFFERSHKTTFVLEKKAINESNIIKVNNGLGVELKREDMPQIKLELYSQFLKYISDNNIRYHEGVQSINTLKPSQSELNYEKYTEKASNFLNGDMGVFKPLIISSDNYLMDGHHFWAGLMEVEPHKMVDVIIVELPIKELISLANSFEKVTHKNIKNQLTEHQERVISRLKKRLHK